MVQNAASPSNKRNMWSLLFVFALALSQCTLPSNAGIHHLSIQDDTRGLIMLEEFGYTRSGRLEIQVKNVHWDTPKDLSVPENYLTFMGLFLATEDDWVQVSHEMEMKSIDCVLKSHAVHILFTFSEIQGSSRSFNHTYPAPGAARYTLAFANCLQQVSVSMDVKTSTYNMEGDIKDYLSDGQTQLPVLYFCFFWIYMLLAGVWVYVCIKQKLTAHRIHVLMGVLVLLKAFYMFSEAEDKFYIKKTGTPHGWDVTFYAFSFLKGVMLFMVIVLIGTGWSFLKPYLQDKEKRVLMVVIPLQVLANIATVVLGETGLSDKNFITWRQLLLLVDVICCCAVLFPIVWSIKHLREAAHSDGKAARNLAKLTLFRQYYIVVVCYIYFTRIVAFALQTITSYHYTWVSELARELATLAFYVFTGYKFRPVPHNPYFVLDEEEEEAAAELVLNDEDFEI